MDYELVLEKAAVYIAGHHYLFEGREVFEYQSETDLLNKP